MTMPAGNPHKYDDMIGLGHPISRTHPPMARIKRAAQFASFDALTGFGAAIHEAGRETEEKKELSEDEIDMIDAKLAVIQYHIKEQPNITVTYFIPDDKKSGGYAVCLLAFCIRPCSGHAGNPHLTDSHRSSLASPCP